MLRDLRLITIDYIQKGVFVPKPAAKHDATIEHITSTRTLGRFHPFAGRLVVNERAAGKSSPCDRITTVHHRGRRVHPCCSARHHSHPHRQGALHSRELVALRLPLNGVINADTASMDNDSASLGKHRLLAAQVTELEDAVIVATSLNHVVSEGITLWHFVNT